MPENPDASNLESHIRSASRPESESDRLLHALADRCWPGGTHDRLEPLARAWLAAWGPERTMTEMPACSCRFGHCVVCN